MLLLSQIIFNGRELSFLNVRPTDKTHQSAWKRAPKEKFFDFDPSKYLFLEKLTGIPIF